jgi:hypothetical protein
MYFPAAQVKQPLDFVLGWYLPGVQALQMAAPGAE